MENKSADTSWLDRNIWRFKNQGSYIPKNQLKLYTSIKDNWTTGKVVLDVGTSTGIGANIMSHNARYVWGVDVNEEAIRFARQMFQRPKLEFEVIDIENPPTRELAKFEIVTMIEVLEHLADPELGLMNLKGKFFNDNTMGFITVPNTNNPKVKAADALNELHNSHWTAGEFYGLMIKHFRSVTLYGIDHLRSWDNSETVDGNTQDRLVIAKVEIPIPPEEIANNG